MQVMGLIDEYNAIGELLGPGVQGNLYELKNLSITLFDIMIGGEYLSAADFLSLTAAYKLPTVPVLAKAVTLRAWLAGKEIAAASNGKSEFNKKKLREGIVVKPMVEQRHGEIGRLILKQRSPEYLAKYDY
jgi:ATP-dependent RNA circularization protein (DNA/RNA ligase family)